MLEKNLEEFKKAKNPFGKLIEHYINLRYGLAKHSYLKTKSKTIKKGKIKTDTAAAWIHGDVPFPIKYLKGFIEELQIPLEELIKVNNEKNPFEPDIEEFKKAKNPLGKLIDYYLYNKKWPPRKHCLINSKTIMKNKIELGTCRYWIRNDSFPIKYLKSFVKELKIPLEKVIELNNGKNPFEPDIEKFKKAKNPLGKLVDYHINLKYGLPIFQYFKNKSKTIRRNNLNPVTVENWARGQKYYLKYIKEIIEELKIPLEKVIELNKGKNPFKPDLEEFKKAKNPFGKLLDFYIDLRYGIDRKDYLKKESKSIKKEKLNPASAGNWFSNKSFPLRYLKAFVDELQIPLEEVVEINNDKNPFRPDLEEFKKSQNPPGKLIKFYVNLKYGYQETYFKNISKTAKKKKLNVNDWIEGNFSFSLKYLKGFINELKIPLEELIAVNNGKNPFKPDIEEFKRAKSPVGRLIDFYIDLRHGLKRENYLKNKSKIIRKEKLNIWTYKNWIRKESFPRKHFKNLIDELKIPIGEVIELSNGKNPFKPDLEEFKKSKSPAGRLIDFYIDLKYGFSREAKHGFSRDGYLKNKSRTVAKEKLGIDVCTNWIIGNSFFPLKYLKSFADELQIPYKEVNYLIDGDIEKGIARSGNVRIEPSTEMILDSVKYYIQQYQKGNKERPSIFYPKSHPEFEKEHGMSTRQIYRSLRK